MCPKMAQNEVLDPGRFFLKKFRFINYVPKNCPKWGFGPFYWDIAIFFGSNALAWQSYLAVVIVNVPAKNISELFQGVNDQKGHHHEWSLQLNLVFGRFLDFYFLLEAEVYKQGMCVCLCLCVCVWILLRIKAGNKNSSGKFLQTYSLDDK